MSSKVIRDLNMLTERFMRMSANYEAVQKELLAAVESDEQTIRAMEQEEILKIMEEIRTNPLKIA